MSLGSSTSLNQILKKKIMTMINCFIEWLTDKKALSLIASQNHCQILTYQLHNSNAPKQDFNLCRIRLKLCQKRKLCNSDKLLHHNVTKHYGLKLSSYGTLFFIKNPDFLIFAMSQAATFLGLSVMILDLQNIHSRGSEIGKYSSPAGGGRIRGTYVANIPNYYFFTRE